jgi:hypothetical protein
MKPALMFAFVSLLVSAPFARAASPGPDCSLQRVNYDREVAAAKAKADLRACDGKKGKEKTACARPLRDKAKAAVAEARARRTLAKKALGCCEKPKAKSCS